MKKLYSLIRACMTSDMNLFKIKQKKKNGKNSLVLPIVLSLVFMFTVWSNANMLFEKLAPLHLQTIFLSMFVFASSVITIIEGVYKSGPLLFNCHDDQLLLSLPIPRRVILFVRIFKFYVFELFFHSLLLIPFMVAYLRWAESIPWTYYFSCFLMIFFLPIIPIVLSCVIGFLISSFASRFKYKNFAQIVVATIFILAFLILSYKMDSFYEYIAKHATSIHDFISKIYYPAGAYYGLVTDFKWMDLFLFVIIHIAIFAATFYFLSIFYFKINSRLKNVTTTKKVKVGSLSFKQRSIYSSFIKKELNTFFKSPVFIINAGFGLVLFFVLTIVVSIKPDTISAIYTEVLTIDSLSSVSIFTLLLLLFSGFMTSITNSVISLEGRRINILKSLPISTEIILNSKILSGLVITTPLLVLGNIILMCRFQYGFFEFILLLLLSILIPLVSHLIGLIINLKYPKLDYESETEVVKQSASSFMAVMIGMIIALTSVIAVGKAASSFSPLVILVFTTIIFLIVDCFLYFYLIRKGSDDFNHLSI